MSSGTDEHGIKIQRSALGGTAFDAGKVQTFVHGNAARFTDLFEQFDVEPSRFIRTSADSDHKHAVDLVWTRLSEVGAIEQGEFTGWYSEREERFITQKEL